MTDLPEMNNVKLFIPEPVPPTEVLIRLDYPTAVELAGVLRFHSPFDTQGLKNVFMFSWTYSSKFRDEETREPWLRHIASLHRFSQMDGHTFERIVQNNSRPGEIF